MNTQTPFPMTQRSIPKNCPECGGDRVLYNVGPQMVAYDPNSKFDIQRQFWTCICTNCGHTTFYMREPEKPPTKNMPQSLKD